MSLAIRQLSAGDLPLMEELLATFCEVFGAMETCTARQLGAAWLREQVLHFALPVRASHG